MSVDTRGNQSWADDGTPPGQTIFMEHKRDRRSFNADGTVTKIGELRFKRRYYIPTADDLAIVRQHFRNDDAERPAWMRIKAMLIVAGHEARTLARSEAPVLLALLAKLQPAGKEGAVGATVNQSALERYTAERGRKLIERLKQDAEASDAELEAWRRDDPAWQALRDDPRYIDLLKMVDEVLREAQDDLPDNWMNQLPQRAWLNEIAALKQGYGVDDRQLWERADTPERFLQYLDNHFPLSLEIAERQGEGLERLAHEAWRTARSLAETLKYAPAPHAPENPQSKQAVERYLFQLADWARVQMKQPRVRVLHRGTGLPMEEYRRLQLPAEQARQEAERRLREEAHARRVEILHRLPENNSTAIRKAAEEIRIRAELSGSIQDTLSELVFEAIRYGAFRSVEWIGLRAVLKTNSSYTQLIVWLQEHRGLTCASGVDGEVRDGCPAVAAILEAEADALEHAMVGAAGDNRTEPDPDGRHTTIADAERGAPVPDAVMFEVRKVVTDWTGSNWEVIREYLRTNGRNTEEIARVTLFDVRMAFHAFASRFNPPGPTHTPSVATLDVTAADKPDDADIPDGFYSGREIAAAMKVPKKWGAIRKALERMMQENLIPDSGWIENRNPARGQPKILYKLSVVRGLLAKYERD